jgi:DNA uptake protein ComE-like DNA-binding protein
MPTKPERTALMFLSAVVLAGATVRVASAVRSGARPAPAAASALAGQRRAVDSAARDRRTPRASPPRGTATAPKKAPRRPAERGLPSTPINVNAATAGELEALPRVGPALAARIVAERTANGPFPDLDALDKRVKGIGPALAAAIQPFVTFMAR